MNGGPKENANPVILNVRKERRAVTERIQFGRAVETALEHAGTTTPFLQSILADSSQPRDIYPIEFSSCRRRRETAEETPGNSSNGSPQATTIDPAEIFDFIRGIQDPEHPNTLEQLGVVSSPQIQITEYPESTHRSTDVRVRFTPTIPHCSMATLIGLTISVQLRRCLPRTTTHVQVEIEPGTHQSETAINEQLADKERVCAALENQHLLGIVNKCIAAENVAAGR